MLISILGIKLDINTIATSGDWNTKLVLYNRYQKFNIRTNY
jgi:hypothetical protein